MKPLLQKSRNDIFCSANLEKYFSLRNLFYKKLKLPSFFISMFCLILSFVLQFNTATAQFLGCRGCTASDDHIDSVVLVQINPAYATDPTQPQYINFPPICSGNSTVTGYLKIAFNQNATTRYGISLTGNILVDGVYSSTFTYCNSDETNSGPFVKYISNFPINFTCGTKLELENLFVGWGNSSDNNVCPIQGNICSLNSNNDNNPHCEQLPLTPGGPPIVIVTPLSADFSATGSCSASQTAQSYSFNALDVINGTTGGTLPSPANAYSWTITNSSNVQVATMTGSNPTYNFSTLGTGTYSVTLTVTDDNPTATSSKSKEVTVISCCNLSAPTSDGDQTECAKSPIQTLTATATGGTITWYDAASGGNVVASPT
ncbi:MAG TPA: hypothetical protein VGW31_00190, partial [Hanamia sp.]|nr:hypothetical protein [Hanamia sp.]